MAHSQIPVSLNFNVLYNVSRGLILFCFILLPIPISHIFYNICSSKRRKKRADSILYEERPHFIQSKIVLSLALLLYAAYVTLISYDTIGKYINLGFTTSFCRLEYAISGYIFITAKALLYNYFILRANDTFYNTAYQFSPCFVQSILPIELIFLFSFMWPFLYWLLYFTNFSVQSTPYNNGEICVLHFTKNINVEHYLQILLGIGGSLEIIISCITLFLLFNKLIIIIQSTTKNIDQYTKKTHPNLMVADEYAHDPRSLILNLSVNSLKDEVQSNSGHTNTTYVAHRIVDFHTETRNNNALLLLITKLLTLLIVQIVSIIISMTFFLMTEMIWFPYVMDSICDIYCLWLTFKFSEKYYYEVFCGIKCTQCLFPFVKTCAISVRYSCCDCCIDNDRIDDFHGSSRYYPVCRCCWCLFCCTRCYKIKDKKKRIYKCVKGEMDILLSTKLDHKPRTDQDVWNQ